MSLTILRVNCISSHISDAINFSENFEFNARLPKYALISKWEIKFSNNKMKRYNVIVFNALKKVSNVLNPGNEVETFIQIDKIGRTTSLVKQRKQNISQINPQTCKKMDYSFIIGPTIEETDSNWQFYVETYLKHHQFDYMFYNKCSQRLAFPGRSEKIPKDIVNVQSSLNSTNDVYRETFSEDFPYIPPPLPLKIDNAANTNNLFYEDDILDPTLHLTMPPPKKLQSKNIFLEFKDDEDIADPILHLTMPFSGDYI